MELKTDYEFISFKEVHDIGKTKVYNVNPKNSIDLIVKVYWYAAWRRYCFWPEPMTLFDAKCLVNISDFISQLMAERKLR